MPLNIVESIHTKAKSLKKGARVTYEVARRKVGGLWAKDVCTTD